MTAGIVVLVVLAVVTVSQLLIQGSERKREHKELMAKLDTLK